MTEFCTILGIYAGLFGMVYVLDRIAKKRENDEHECCGGCCNHDEDNECCGGCCNHDEENKCCGGCCNKEDK